jgi:hypothetical protein
MIDNEWIVSIFHEDVAHTWMTFGSILVVLIVVVVVSCIYFFKHDPAWKPVIATIQAVNYPVNSPTLCTVDLQYMIGTESLVVKDYAVDASPTVGQTMSMLYYVGNPTVLQHNNRSASVTLGIISIVICSIFLIFSLILVLRKVNQVKKLPQEWLKQSMVGASKRRIPITTPPTI